MISVTRRLILSVLLTEAAAGLALITTLGFHEYRLQRSAFDTTLRSSAESLLGAVQDAEDAADNVMLDNSALHLPHNAIYRVQEDGGRILGEAGPVPPQDSRERQFFVRRIGRTAYRLFLLRGARTIDPGSPGGGITHHVTITFGLPFGKVWHEVFESIRFSVIASAVLLSTTALVMVFVMRRVLQPLHDLATRAEQISPASWTFAAPQSAQRTTELKPLADALSAALARLELSFTQQKRFTSDAAHELKTGVAIIKSSLQLLAMKPRSNEEYRAGLQKAFDDIERLESTVRTMLTLARLEQPAAGPPSLCCLAQAAEESLSLCTPYAEMRSVGLSSDLAVDPLVAVEMRDAVLLCSNLLMNAIQHSPAGQSVVISLMSTGPSIRLIIRDHGDGIGPEDLPFVMDPFYRGDPSRSRKSGGSGLGLAICKAICDRAQGSIEIQSELEKGTTVIVTLPCRDTTPVMARDDSRIV